MSGLLGTAALMVLVLVAVVVGVSGVVAVQWRLLTELRAVRREQEELRAFREQTDRRTTRLLELARAGKRAQEQQTATSKAVAEDVTATSGRVLALGRLLARQGASSRQQQPAAAPPSDPSA